APATKNVNQITPKPNTPAPLPKDPPPAGTGTGVISKTFYITDGSLPLAKSDAGESIAFMDVYFRGFSTDPKDLNVPGEGLIIREGDAVEITIINTLTSDHNFTIDKIVNINIAAGATEIARFTAGAPGTYMYYDASNPPYNRLLGLHGALAIMPAKSDNQPFPNSRSFVKQQFWVFNDIDPIWNNSIRDGLNTSRLGAFKPRYFTMNGLSGRPPRAPGYDKADQSSMKDLRTILKGGIGDRTLIRCVNASKMKHSMHLHANHMEWLPKPGEARQDVWEKDIVALQANGGIENVIYPFAPPPDAINPFTNDSLLADEKAGVEVTYPMHLHDEMTQTAAGGSYQFGTMTDIYYVSK
ncbi:MAG: hypothetical protein ACC657_15410, partial [Thiohalomonadales bacterium]